MYEQSESQVVNGWDGIERLPCRWVWLGYYKQSPRLTNGPSARDDACGCTGQAVWAILWTIAGAQTREECSRWHLLRKPIRANYTAPSVNVHLDSSAFSQIHDSQISNFLKWTIALRFVSAIHWVKPQTLTLGFIELVYLSEYDTGGFIPPIYWLPGF